MINTIPYRCENCGKKEGNFDLICINCFKNIPPKIQERIKYEEINKFGGPRHWEAIKEAIKSLHPSNNHLIKDKDFKPEKPPEKFDKGGNSPVG